MPIDIQTTSELKIGDIYEDSSYHPCLCMGVDGYEVWGVSLIDGSYPRCEDIGLSGIRKLTVEEAWTWRVYGPTDVVLEEKDRWWNTDDQPRFHANASSNRTESR